MGPSASLLFLFVASGGAGVPAPSASGSPGDLPPEVVAAARVAHEDLARWFESTLTPPTILVVNTVPPPPLEAARFGGGEIRIQAQAIANPLETRRLVRHEMTHAFVAALAGEGCPLWLHEGLAQLHDGSDPAHALRLLKGRPALPVLFVAPFPETARPESVRVAYAMSLAAVHALVERSGREGVVDLLRRIGRGIPAARGLIDCCGLGETELRQVVAARAASLRQRR